MRFSRYLFLLIGFFSFSATASEKSIAYDSHGNISKLLLPHAGEVLYFYDPIDRLTEIHYPDGETVKYAYDFNSNLIKVITDQGTTLYTYDFLNRIHKAEFHGGVNITYDYDPASRIKRIIYPDKQEVNYEYDIRGRLVQVLDQTGNTRYGYDDETNLIVKEELANGIITEYAYDNIPRVTKVSHKNSNGVLIVEYGQ